MRRGTNEGEERQNCVTAYTAERARAWSSVNGTQRDSGGKGVQEGTAPQTEMRSQKGGI